MKRIIALTLVTIMLVFVLASCGNENWGFGNYNWTHIHFTDAVEGHCATITSWHNNETGIEVHTQECGSIFLSEGSYILFDTAEHCPFCE